MTSGGHFLEGDGPPAVGSEHRACKEYPWTNIPIPVFEKLCKLLGSTFVHIARQVSPSWLNNIENLVGLTVKVDDTVPGNLEFVQSVKVVQARIVNWTVSEPGVPVGPEWVGFDSNLLFQFPHCLRKLTICGKVPKHWKLEHLQEFTNLTHLVLRGVSLYSNNITGYPFVEPTEDLSPEGRLQEYESFEPYVLPAPIYLRRLKRLELIMNEFSYPASLPLSVRLENPERAMEQEAVFQRLYFIVLNNVTFILNNCLCRSLSTIQFYIYPKAGYLAPPKINWRHLPLQRFLGNHQSCLKEVYLPEFEGQHDLSATIDMPRFPTRLSKVQANLTKFIGDREEAREQECAYWQKFLMEQTQLAEVLLTFSDFSTPWLDDTLTNLLFGSKETLRFVDIAIQSEETVQVNLEMFAFCHNLIVLKINGRDHETILRNINKLPCSLTKLYISMSLVEPPIRDTDFLKKYTNLEMVVVKTIMVADQPYTHGRTLAMLRNIFSLRKLNLLMLTFDAPLNSNRDLMHLLRAVDEEVDSPYPVFTVKLNLSYEFQEGWNEDIFDEDALDLEYINMREPEDYSRYQNRRRNALDENDHRIFIFQTLPFLLDLRDGGTPGVMGIAGNNHVTLAEDDDDGNADDEDTTGDTDSDDESVVYMNDSSTDI